MDSLLCCLTNDASIEVGAPEWAVLRTRTEVGGASGCCSWLTQRQQQGQIVDELEVDY